LIRNLMWRNPFCLKGMDQGRLSIVIDGIVQGVFFRISAKQKAEELGIVGYAENLPDGKVKIMAEGNKDSLHQFLGWCHKGSSFARVSHVSFHWEKVRGNINEFSIR